jgi:RNA polymerase sigma factor (sigma-70 family)
MKAPYPVLTMASDQDERISDAVRTEQTRLRNFIRRRVPDSSDAEDILQDVFYELVETYRSMETIEQMGAWLFRVARNRIIDLFRKKRPVLLADEIDVSSAEDEGGPWEELLPSGDAGPEEVLLRSAMLEELEDALDELPDEQRQVFLAHEIEGRSFKEISEETGVGVNTLLSRKRYAVLHLRRRLQAAHEDLRE